MKPSFKKYIEATGLMNNTMQNPATTPGMQSQIQDPKLKQAIANAKQLVSKTNGTMNQNPADQSKLQATKQILTTAQGNKDKADLAKMVQSLDQQQKPAF